jgi:hypothetical protein
MTYFERIIGFDPNGIHRIYGSTWIEAQRQARNYIRKRPDTAPLSAWRFEPVVLNAQAYSPVIRQGLL